MTKIRFRDKSKQAAYAYARAQGADTTSTYYYNGVPYRGAGHRCAYWDGFNGVKSIYSDPSIVAYPFWCAGADDRKAAAKQEG